MFVEKKTSTLLQVFNLFRMEKINSIESFENVDWIRQNRLSAKLNKRVEVV